MVRVGFVLLNWLVMLAAFVFPFIIIYVTAKRIIRGWRYGEWRPTAGGDGRSR